MWRSHLWIEENLSYAIESEIISENENIMEKLFVKKDPNKTTLFCFVLSFWIIVKDSQWTSKI